MISLRCSQIMERMHATLGQWTVLSLDDMLQISAVLIWFLINLDVNELLLIFTSLSFGLISRALYANRPRLSIFQAQKIRILRCVRHRLPIIPSQCLMQYELIWVGVYCDSGIKVSSARCSCLQLES